MSNRYSACYVMFSLAASILGLVISSAASAAICQVTTLGTGAGAATWASPVDLQTALDNLACSEIWVETGTYKPTTMDADPRKAKFLIHRVTVSPVAIYGGFVGTETERDARNPATHPTILSGDVGTPGDNSDNSYSVVYMDGSFAGGSITASTVLDGFTIRDGNANGDFPQNIGGGLTCNGRLGGQQCSPTLSNLIFSGNRAGFGGALFNDGSGGGYSSPILDNVVFSGNSATTIAGAMYNQGSNGTSSPALNNVTFSGNSAPYAGAMYCLGNTGISSPALNGVTFSGNNASASGGAIYILCSSGVCAPVLSNVTFNGNTAGSVGGAIYIESDGGNITPLLDNVTFNANSAAFAGGAMFNNGSNGNASPTLRNVILWGNSLQTGGIGMGIYNAPNGGIASPAIDHSVLQDSGGSGAGWDASLGSDGGGNLDADPLLGTLQDNGGLTQTQLPGSGSSAIDTGDDGVCANAPVNGVDQRGVTRLNGAHCDIGAVEISDLIFADGFDSP